MIITIIVYPGGSTIGKKEQVQFAATGHYSDGSTADITSSVTWASSDPLVATIDPSGLATGEGKGAATITATLGSVHGSTFLNVDHKKDKPK